MPTGSVKTRLVLLVGVLLASLGGANLLLANFLYKREAQEIEQRAQYDRLQAIQQVAAAMFEVRHQQSALNVARLVADPEQQALREAQLKLGELALEQSLDAMAEFDADGVQQVRRERELSILSMQKTVDAMARKQADSQVLAQKTTAHLTAIQTILLDAYDHQRLQAELLTASQIGDARWAAVTSLLIVLASLLVAVVSCVLVLRSIIGPLNLTSQALRQINDGHSMIDLPPITQDEFGDIAQALRQFRDQADKLRDLAYNDALTGLANRARMDMELRQAVIRSRQRGSSLALLVIDLDNFGGVNDGLGYTGGDAYLREASQRLLRFAPEEALVCRYSGDKFAVLIEIDAGASASSAASGESIWLRDSAELILRGMSESFSYHGHLLPMSVSIGISLFPEHSNSEAELISGADAAMYLVKQEGRNGIRFADRSMSVGAREDLETVADIRRGIEQREFEPHYQPIVDTERGVVAGAEALLRWQHPQRGLLTADRFIPAAEASGQIHDLGAICLRRVGAQLVEWQDTGAPALWISANLSIRQIEKNELLPQLRQLSSRTGFVPNSLMLEITESAALDSVDKASETLEAVRRLGFQLGMDDFGTGYSSMIYLQRFPVDKIKIDRLFVHRMDSSREALAIVSAVIAIARSLKLQVVAEGVETEAQSRQLREMGCHLQQGFLFARALPPVEFASWRKSYAASAAA